MWGRRLGQRTEGLGLGGLGTRGIALGQPGEIKVRGRGIPAVEKPHGELQERLGRLGMRRVVLDPGAEGKGLAGTPLQGLERVQECLGVGVAGDA